VLLFKFNLLFVGVLQLEERLVLMLLFIYLCNDFADARVVVGFAWLRWCWWWIPQLEYQQVASGNDVEAVDNNYEAQGSEDWQRKRTVIVDESCRSLVARAVQADLLAECQMLDFWWRKDIYWVFTKVTHWVIWKKEKKKK